MKTLVNGIVVPSATQPSPAMADEDGPSSLAIMFPLAERMKGLQTLRQKVKEYLDIHDLTPDEQARRRQDIETLASELEITAMDLLDYEREIRHQERVLRVANLVEAVENFVERLEQIAWRPTIRPELYSSEISLLESAMSTGEKSLPDEAEMEALVAELNACLKLGLITEGDWYGWVTAVIEPYDREVINQMFHRFDVPRYEDRIRNPEFHSFERGDPNAWLGFGDLQDAFGLHVFVGRGCGMTGCPCNQPRDEHGRFISS